MKLQTRVYTLLTSIVRQNGNDRLAEYTKDAYSFNCKIWAGEQRPGSGVYIKTYISNEWSLARQTKILKAKEYRR